jgi:prolyl-tRNA editing enzyme YbaK/EbsC (Cys-tRNA(Pro) deacylase)
VWGQAGLEIGAIPPFGSTMNLPTYLDEEITQNEGIVFNVGAHTKSIKMKPTDFLKLEKPVVGNFS